MGPRNLDFVLSEANGNRSYDTVTIRSGAGKLQPGTILGRVTADKKFTASPNAEVAGIEGAETAVAVLAYGVDATSADVEAVILARDAEVKKHFLIAHASVNDDTKLGAKHAQLRAAGVNIHVR